MEILLIITGLLLTIAGLIGCIIPALPGPPLNFAALLLLSFSSSADISGKSLLVLGVLVVIITAIDYLLPVFGGKAFGVSNYGVIGSFAGMAAGIVFFPPFGMFFGIILGAVAGELLAGKDNSAALKAGFATFALTVFMLVVKLCLSVYLAYLFLAESISVLF